MEEVEVKVVHLALLQLLVKDFLHLVHVGQVVAGKFGGQKEAVPGVFLQNPAHDGLRIAGVVAPGGVVVVDPRLHGLGPQLGGLFLIWLGIIGVGVVSGHGGQAHAAKAQGGELSVLKLLVNHKIFLSIDGYSIRRYNSPVSME